VKDCRLFEDGQLQNWDTDLAGAFVDTLMQNLKV